MARTLQERIENSKDKKGSPICLFQKDEDGALTQIAGEDQHIRDESDIKAVLEELNFIGIAIPLRPTIGAIKRGKIETVGCQRI